MNTTANISNKGDNRVSETSVYQAWRAHLDAVLAEAGVTLVPRSISDSSRVYGLKDTGTDVSMGATITMQEYAIRTIEANLLRSALADAEERAMEPSGVKPDVDMAERRFTRRMRRNLNRLEPTLAYLNGRLYDILKDSPKQVSAVYGIMKGETEPSAFLAVTEPGRTPSGETLGERHLLETHTPNDVLGFFGLEAAKRLPLPSRRRNSAGQARTNRQESSISTIGTHRRPHYAVTCSRTERIALIAGRHIFRAVVTSSARFAF